MPNLHIRHLLSVFLVGSLIPAPVVAEVDQATVLAARPAVCSPMPPQSAEGGVEEDLLQRFEVKIPGQEEAQPTIVWQVPCGAGAYNRIFAYWVEDSYGGLRQLAFAMPVVETVMERPDDPESPVREARVTGWTASTMLVSATFDPATLTFSHTAMARGLGDAFNAGTWQLGLDQAVIQTFDVDASYDGEVNPVKVYPTP